MEIRRVRADRAEICRFVEACWLPYHEDLDDADPAHSLVDGLDQEAVVDHYCDRLDSPAHRLWVALADGASPSAALSQTDAKFAGFVHTSLAASPGYLDWPDRLAVDDIWVRAEFRGSGLADDLVTRATQHAREDGCPELTVKMGVANDRAVEYFERLGFEATGYRMHVSLAALDVEASRRLTGRHASCTLRRLRAEESAMAWFVETCWRPFWEALGEAVGKQHLDPDLDRAALVEELLDSYDVPDRRCFVALDDPADATVGLAETDGEVAGWLNAGLEPTDEFLDPPERLFVGNLYTAPEYRGTGLADQLLARAVQYAREEGCCELSLGVDAANDRAMAYYEKHGFEPLRGGMLVSLDDLSL